MFKKSKWWLAVISLLVCLPAPAQLLDTKGVVTTNDTAPRVFTFRTEPGTIRLRFDVNTSPGTVSFEVRDPGGRILGRQSAGIATINEWSIAITNAGNYELVVTPYQTAGYWNVRIERDRPLSALYQQTISGVLVILVALAAALGWGLYRRVQWRWFWAGAAIWAVGVTLKFAVAFVLNPIFIGKSVHATGLKLVIGSVYCGLMTGAFEIGVTLAAALFWRKLAATPERAVAIGIGAGAFEALLLGLVSSLGSIAALASGQTEDALRSLAALSANTSLLWLAGPAERVIAILAHTASRVMVLRAVATHRWTGFWIGFSWLSAVDLVAGVALLTGMTTTCSIWCIEAMLAPFGLLSIPLLTWAIRHWPTDTAPNNPSEPPLLEHPTTAVSTSTGPHP